VEAGLTDDASYSGTTVEVALMGFISDVATSRRTGLQLPPGASLRDALESLAGMQGEQLLRRLMTSAGTLQPGVLVTAGGERVSDLDTPLPQGSPVPLQIMVLQAAAGG
jgi:hypothetical protein